MLVGHASVSSVWCEMFVNQMAAFEKLDYNYMHNGGVDNNYIVPAPQMNECRRFSKTNVWHFYFSCHRFVAVLDIRCFDKVIQIQDHPLGIFGMTGGLVAYYRHQQTPNQTDPINQLHKAHRTAIFCHRTHRLARLP